MKKPTVWVKPLVESVLDDRGCRITAVIEVVETERIKRRIKDGDLEVVSQPTEVISQPTLDVDSPQKGKLAKPKQED